AGVGRRLARIPLAGRGRGVIQRLVVDGEAAGLAAGLRERELDAVDQWVGLGRRGALQRQAGIDVDGVATASTRCRRAAARRSAGGCGAARAGLVAAAARGQQKQGSHDQAYADRLCANTHKTSSSSWSTGLSVP